MKPVRDTVLHALQYWRSLPGPDTPEPSEAGSSIKGLVASSPTVQIGFTYLSAYYTFHLVGCEIVVAFYNLRASFILEYEV